MRIRNRLWNPEHDRGLPKRKKQPPQPFNDPLCEGCAYIGRCTKGACRWMLHINGNAPLKEPLYSDLNGNETFITQDYNISLSELIEDAQDRFEYIINIPNIKKRAIAALLAAKLTKTEISGLFKMSLRQIIRISQQ